MTREEKNKLESFHNTLLQRKTELSIQYAMDSNANEQKLLGSIEELDRNILLFDKYFGGYI